MATINNNKSIKLNVPMTISGIFRYLNGAVFVPTVMRVQLYVPACSYMYQPLVICTGL